MEGRSPSARRHGLGPWELNSVFLVDTAGGGVRELDLPYQYIEPYWRPPDGRQLLFYGSDASGNGLFLVTVDTGSVERLPVPDTGSALRPLGWTPDGRRLAYQIDGPGEYGQQTRILDLETGAEILLPVAARAPLQRRHSSGRWPPERRDVRGPDRRRAMRPDRRPASPAHRMQHQRRLLVAGRSTDLRRVGGRQPGAVPRGPRSGRQSLAPWVVDGGASWQRR